MECDFISLVYRFNYQTLEHEQCLETPYIKTIKHNCLNKINRIFK